MRMCRGTLRYSIIVHVHVGRHMCRYTHAPVGERMHGYAYGCAYRYAYLYVYIHGRVNVYAYGHGYRQAYGYVHGHAVGCAYVYVCGCLHWCAYMNVCEYVHRRDMSHNVVDTCMYRISICIWVCTGTHT